MNQQKLLSSTSMLDHVEQLYTYAIQLDQYKSSLILSFNYYNAQFTNQANLS